VEKDLRGEQMISDEHVDNNKAVRKMLVQRGVEPESLPAAEDVNAVKKRLKTEDKKVLKGAKKGKGKKN